MQVPIHRAQAVIIGVGADPVRDADRAIQSLASAQVDPVKTRIAAVPCEIDDDDDSGPRTTSEGTVILTILFDCGGKKLTVKIKF